MIAPTLDPTGSSVVHSADARVKLVWLLCLSAAATWSGKLAVEALLLCETTVLYIVVARGKRTPPPPVPLMILILAVLLFSLNILFSSTGLRKWGNAVSGQAAESAVLDATTKAFRVATTALAFFVFTLSTVPRDLARGLEIMRVKSWLTEPLAIALRFLPVFEVNLRMLNRVALTRFPRSPKVNAVSSLRYVRALAAGMLILALSQANVTSASLTLRRFDARSPRAQYLAEPDRRASQMMALLAFLSLVVVFF